MADLPIGTILIYPSKNVPEGFLPCDGRKVSKRAYPELYALLHSTFGETSTEFYLPDLQGQFIRGWDKDGNVDPERQFGKEQKDAFQGHAHKVIFASELKTERNGDHTHEVSQHSYDRDFANTWFTRYWVNTIVNFEYVNNQNYRTSYDGEHSHTISIPNDFIKIQKPCDSTHGIARVDTETRPKNIALMFCIKVK